jgi:Sensors of blue-light using FAD
MNLEAVAYTSSATHGTTAESLEQLLLRARATNSELEVTGVLLFHDGSFFQYFEGPTAGVDDVYSRILRSPMHRGIIELMRQPIERRSFGNWHMGFTKAPASTLLAISNASWRSHVRHASPAASDGLGLLLQFWSANRGELSL